MPYQLQGKAVRILKLPTVDYEKTPVKVVPAQQGDANARYFCVSFYDDRGEISLLPYNGVILYATLPDGTVQTSAGELNKHENVIYVELPSSMIAVTGKVVCNIVLTGDDTLAGGDSAGITLTSQPFYVFVGKSIAAELDDDVVVASDTYKALEQIYQQISELKTQVEGIIGEYSSIVAMTPCQLSMTDGEDVAVCDQLILEKEGGE